MLSYTYTDMEATKYAKSTVNVRDLPSTEGDKVGSLSANEKVIITGQCNETGWYRIAYEGVIAYVSDSYLADKKADTAETAPPVENPAPAPDNNGSTTPYPITPEDSNGDGVPNWADEQLEQNNGPDLPPAGEVHESGIDSGFY